MRKQQNGPGRWRRLAVALLAAVQLAGCAAVLPGSSGQGAWGGSEAEPMPDGGGSQPFGGSAPAARDYTARDIAYGSAKTLDEVTAVVSVYLDEGQGTHAWDDDSIAESRRQISQAAVWITSACRGYGAAAPLVFDDGSENCPLFCHTAYDGWFTGGKDADEGDDFYDAMDALCARLDTSALEAAYNTDSVAFLVFLPVAGSSYTMVHYQSDGAAYYYEYSCLYRYDAWADTPGTAEGPMVCAHELLHQFGAADLYEGSSDAEVTPELTDFVTENWPTAIMLDTGLPGEPARVLCPVTAYRLGLISTFDGLENFPALAATTPGVFSAADASAETAWPDDPWQGADGAVAA